MVQLIAPSSERIRCLTAGGFWPCPLFIRSFLPFCSARKNCRSVAVEKAEHQDQQRPFLARTHQRRTPTAHRGPTTFAAGRPGEGNLRWLCARRLRKVPGVAIIDVVANSGPAGCPSAAGAPPRFRWMKGCPGLLGGYLCIFAGTRERHRRRRTHRCSAAPRSNHTVLGPR